MISQIKDAESRHQEQRRLVDNLRENLREARRAKELSPKYREEAGNLLNEAALLSGITPWTDFASQCEPMANMKDFIIMLNHEQKKLQCCSSKYTVDQHNSMYKYTITIKIILQLYYKKHNVYVECKDYDLFSVFKHERSIVLSRFKI